MLSALAPRIDLRHSWKLPQTTRSSQARAGKLWDAQTLGITERKLLWDAQTLGITERKHPWDAHTLGITERKPLWDAQTLGITERSSPDPLPPNRAEPPPPSPLEPCAFWSAKHYACRHFSDTAPGHPLIRC